MNIKSVNKDIQSLEKALTLIQNTENNTMFLKSHLMMELCEQINVLKEKRDKQLDFIRSLS